MPLTVLSVAYPLAPVGPDAVGGSEQILSALDAALVARGDRSIVVAHQRSQVAGELIATHVPDGRITDDVRARVREEHQRNLEREIAKHPIDLIHYHGLDFHEYRVPDDVPALATLHLPPSWYPASIWTGRGPLLQCVSRHQQRNCPDVLQPLPVIENGVAVDGASKHHRRRNFALSLGRICPEKNLHIALEAGTRANTPVLLGGHVYPYPDHERYYEAEILPRLYGRHRFLGALGAGRKKRLLRAAKCLLLPTLAPETSSLVAMEAMAEGTPVIAFPSGAIPEIVRDGVTGFLVSTANEMADAMQRVHEIDPERCRREAGLRFSQQRMVEEYFSLYTDLVQSEARPQEQEHAAD